MKGSLSERGANLVEYAIAAAILVGVFALVGALLTRTAQEGAGASTNTVQDVVPCHRGQGSTGATGLQGAECY